MGVVLPATFLQTAHSVDQEPLLGERWTEVVLLLLYPRNNLEEAQATDSRRMETGNVGLVDL